MTTGAPGWPKAWANETLAVAVTAFKGLGFGSRYTVVAKDQNGKETKHDAWMINKEPAGYNDMVRDTAVEQVAKAGHRLAELLKAIWP